MGDPPTAKVDTRLIERVGLSNVVHRAFHRFQDIVGELAFSYAPKRPGQTACHGRMPSVE